jgi:hypothetical protein
MLNKGIIDRLARGGKRAPKADASQNGAALLLVVIALAVGGWRGLAWLAAMLVITVPFWFYDRWSRGGRA